MPKKIKKLFFKRPILVNTGFTTEKEVSVKLCLTYAEGVTIAQVIRDKMC